MKQAFSEGNMKDNETIWKDAQTTKEYFPASNLLEAESPLLWKAGVEE